MNSLKKTLTAGIGLLFVALGTVGSTAKAEDRLSVSTKIDYASKYIWRGYNVYDDASLQPGASLAANVLGGSISAGWWSSMDLQGVEENQFIEHDWTAAYSIDTLGGSLEAGVIYYYFPGSTDELTDVYLSYEAGLGKSPVTASIAAYYEAKEIEGFYITAGLSAEFKVTEKWTLGIGTSLGLGDEDYNKFTWGVDDAALNDFNLSVSMSAAIDERSSISIGVNYTELLDSDIADAAEDDTTGWQQSDSVWFVAGIEIAI